jgi:outer membrane protein
MIRFPFLPALAGALTVFVLGITMPVHGQGLKIGYVNDERIFQEYESIRKAQEQWEVERKAWDEEALTKQEELRELQAEYEKQKLILSEDKRREKEAAIDAKRDGLDAYTKQVFGPDGTAERKYQQLVQPLIDNIQKAIEGVGIEENYDVIFTLQGIGYIKEAYDVTDKVLKYIDEHED